MLLFGLLDKHALFVTIHKVGRLAMLVFHYYGLTLPVGVKQSRLGKMQTSHRKTVLWTYCIFKHISIPRLFLGLNLQNPGWFATLGSSNITFITVSSLYPWSLQYVWTLAVWSGVEIFIINTYLPLHSIVASNIHSSVMLEGKPFDLSEVLFHILYLSASLQFNCFVNLDCWV